MLQVKTLVVVGLHPPVDHSALILPADLSLIAGALDDGDTTLTFGADFTLGDVMNSDPMLTFEPGIT